MTMNQKQFIESNREELRIRAIEKTLPWNYRVCRTCLKVIKINKLFFGSLHICD